MKSPIVSHAEKDPLPSSGSVSVGKAEASKPSRLKAEHPVSSLSSSPQPKAGLGASYVAVTSSSPVAEERDIPNSAVGSASMDSPISVLTSSSDGSRTGAVYPDSFKDKPKTPGSRGQQEQVIHGLLLLTLFLVCWAGFSLQANLS